MKTVLVIYDDTRFDKQIIYTSNIIFKDYNVKLRVLSREEFNALKSQGNCANNEDSLVIFYGCDNAFQADIIILKGKLFGKDYLNAASLPEKVDFYNNIPVFFMDDTKDFIYKKINNRVIYNNDILQTVFFFLTCYEEYVINDYDKYGRFIAKNSFLYKHNLINRPVVNENINYFMKIVYENFGVIFIKKCTWKGRGSAVVLTHDVAAVYKYLPVFKEIRLMLSIILVDRKLMDVFKRIREHIDVKLKKLDKNPFDTFDYIIESEKKYRFNSSYYFMADDKCYNISENKVKNIINKLKKNNSEIGLHPGFGTELDDKLLKKQLLNFFDAIGFSDEIGVRQHYLAFYGCNTWRIQEKCGIKYDVTLSHPDYAGFKTGYCLPYKPYDLKENRVINVWEIPLIVMDGSLIDYMKLDFEESKKHIMKLLDGVKEAGGVFVILWHNSSLNSEYCPYAKKLFDWSYNYMYSMGYLVGSSLNILNQYVVETGEFNCLF